MNRIVLAAVAMALGSLVSCSPAAEPLSDQASLGAAVTGAARFTYEDLVLLIQGQGFTTLEQVLPALPADFRSGYALVHDSRSLQEASYASPRAIVFGTDARLTCAFNGDPSQQGFDALECFQFREAERLFDFRQIRFPTPANGLTAVAFSASNQATDGTVSCTGCHGADPRPNWDSYDTWVGAYGASDDGLGSDAARYAAFVARRPADPRYRTLVQGSNPTDPYMAGNAIGIDNRPNLKFSDAAGRMNALRATRILESRTPSWQTLAFGVKALGCTLSPEQRDALASAGFDVAKELDLGRIFATLGLSSREWGMQIFDDPPTIPDQPWEHQSGFAFLSVDIGMALAQEGARAGDVALSQGLARIAAYYAAKYSGAELRYYSALNEVVPDPEMFGGHYPDNTGYVCPELVHEFVAKALAGRVR